MTIPLPVTGTGNQLTLTRIRSVDLLRGAVMVLMALDHVRVYAGVPAGGPDPAVFFTRWVTHFCAPAFVFFAGTGAFLHGIKLNNKKALSKYLFTRGLLLVILELTLIKFEWTFNIDYTQFVLAGVIWMLGWCMVFMAALVRLPVMAIGITGLCIIFLQQAFSWLPGIFSQQLQNSIGPVWEFFYPAGLPRWPAITILYVLVPWIGVMLTGYAFGALMLREPAIRRRWCLSIGLFATALFIVAGSLFILLQPEPGNQQPFIFKLLDQRKYPASPLYLLMTLGPAIALIPFAEKMRGRLAKVLLVFGRVPMFYYLLHIAVIHIIALVIMLIREGSASFEWYRYAPFAEVPGEAQWPLPLLYLAFIIAVTILYFPCRWYATYKAAHPGKKWLKYL